MSILPLSAVLEGWVVVHPDTAGGAAASHQLCKSPTDTGLPNQTSIDQSIDWEDNSTNKSMIVS